MRLRSGGNVGGDGCASHKFQLTGMLCRQRQTLSRRKEALKRRRGDIKREEREIERGRERGDREMGCAWWCMYAG